MFFAVEPQKAVIGDFNPQLIGMYQAIQNHLCEVETYLDAYQGYYNRLESDVARCAYYYKQRERFNAKIEQHISDAESAALLIFLNKAGFNGLYRVSKTGKYNVPSAHRKNISLYTKDNIRQVSDALGRADILCGDFENVIKNAKEGDFVFFDSPYYDTFDQYSSNGFTKEDHERLARIFAELSEKGVQCMLTNSNTEFIKNLYGNNKYWMQTVPVKRAVNCDAANRVGEEIIITNYAAACTDVLRNAG